MSDIPSTPQVIASSHFENRVADLIGDEPSGNIGGWPWWVAQNQKV